MVREDVVQAGSSLETLLRKGWFEGLPLDMAGWQEHRSALAGALPKEDWDDIAGAMADLRRVEVMVTELLALGNGEIEPEAIPPDGRDILDHTIRTLQRARDLLDQIA